jgi:SAM-dependent methyltransferase
MEEDSAGTLRQAQSVAQVTRNLYSSIHDRQLLEGTSSRLPNFLDHINLDLAGAHCLDLGCGGTARDALHLFERNVDTVTLVDVGSHWQQSVERELRQNHIAAHRYRFETVDEWLARSTKEGAGFDFVVCNGVLHHVQDEAGTLGAITRDMVPGGHMYLMVMGKGGLVRDMVMGFLRDRYATEPSFRSYMDSTPEDMVSGVELAIDSLLGSRTTPLAPQYNCILEGIKAGFDIDLALTLKDRVNSPIYRQYSMEQASELLGSQGWHVIQRVYPTTKFTNLRAILEPVYENPHDPVSHLLFGGGNLHLLAKVAEPA